MVKSLLKLGDNVALFEPSNNLSDIFHDRLNQKIITVRNDGSLGISAKGFGKDDNFNFRVQPAGKIETINFSPNMKVASIHRDETSADFVFLDQKNKDDTHPITSQPCKAKDAKIMALEWVKEDQIVYITSQGLELYYVYPKKKTLKFYRNSDVNVEWALYYPSSQLIICASGRTSAVMNPFVIQNGYIHKLARFEVDFGCSNLKPKLDDKSVLIASIYEKIYLLVIKSGAKEAIKQINMYEIFSDVAKPIELSHVLVLNLDDHVGLHAIDNLVVVHHRRTAKSYIFDIKLPATGDKPPEHAPAVLTPISVSGNLNLTYGDSIFEVYPWFILPPNQVVDTRRGIFSEITLQLDCLWDFFEDKTLLLRFVMNRTKHEKLMLSVIQQLLLDKRLPLSRVASVFNEIYNPGSPQTPVSMLSRYDSTKFKLLADEYKPMTAGQKAIIDAVFSPLGDNSEMDKKWLSNVLLEFLLILKQCKTRIDNYLPELLIMVMSEAREYSRLQQIFQHKVIDDSKFLAFKLIEISKNHPPLFQLAMDMLARRGNNAHIVRFLLERNQVIDAIRAGGFKEMDESMCAKVLEAAWRSNNRQIKYTVYYYIHDVARLPCLETPAFEKYAKDFKALFDTEEIIEAETRFRLARISSTPVPLHSISSETSFELPLSASFRE